MLSCLDLLLSAATHDNLEKQEQTNSPPVPVRQSALLFSDVGSAVYALLQECLLFRLACELAFCVQHNGLVEVDGRSRLHGHNLHAHIVLLTSSFARSRPVRNLETHMIYLALLVQQKLDLLVLSVREVCSRRCDAGPAACGGVVEANAHDLFASWKLGCAVRDYGRLVGVVSDFGQRL